MATPVATGPSFDPLVEIAGMITSADNGVMNQLVKQSDCIFPIDPYLRSVASPSSDLPGPITPVIEGARDSRAHRLTYQASGVHARVPRA